MTNFIKDLELSVRASNVLTSEGVSTREQFMALDRVSVMAMKGAGSRVWKEIAEVQASLNAAAVPVRWPEQDWLEFQNAVGALNERMVNNPRLRVVAECDGCLTAVLSSSRDGERRATRWFN